MDASTKSSTSSNKPEENPFRASQEMGATFKSTVINVVNCIIGAGILSIPATIHSTGLIGSFLLLTISLVLSLFGSYFLVVSATYTKKDTFGGIAGVLYNKTITILSDITLIIYQIGISTAYSVILFEQVLDLLQAWGGVDGDWLWSNRWWITLLVTLAFSVPLLAIKNLDMLKYTSIGAILCIVLFVVISIYLGIDQLVKGPLHYNLFPESPKAVAASIAVFSTSLCFHTAIPKLNGELRYPRGSKFPTKVKKMTVIGIIAACFSCLLYYIVGMFAYFAFGDTIAGNLLTNFQAKGYWYLGIVKLAYALVVLFSNPVVVLPGITTIDQAFFKGERTLVRRLVESLIWSLLVWVLAIAIPQLDVVFGLTGSTGGILLIYVLPSVYYIAVVKRIQKRVGESLASMVGPHWLYPFAHILILIAVALGVVSTISQISSL